MNKFLRNALILGSVLELLNFVINIFDNVILNVMFIFVFIISFIMLLIKRDFKSFNKLKANYPKIYNYMLYMGGLWYISFFAMTLFATYGYNYTNAHYHGLEYESIIPSLIPYISITYLLVAIISFIYATYINFFKKK